MLKVREGTAIPAPPPETIAEFEREWRVTLPADYLSALKIANGAELVTNVFDQGKRGRMIQRMLYIVDDPNRPDVPGGYYISHVMSVVGERLTDRPDEVGIPVVPIAELFAGDMVCLDFRADPKQPTVAVWDHERSEEFAPWLETIAPSFTAFSDMLRASR